MQSRERGRKTRCVPLTGPTPDHNPTLGLRRRYKLAFGRGYTSAQPVTQSHATPTTSPTSAHGAATYHVYLGRRAARYLRYPPRTEGRARAGARLPVATLHRPLLKGLSRAHAQGPARAAGGADPTQILRTDSGEEARQRLGEATAQLERPLPKVTVLLKKPRTSLPSTRFPQSTCPSSGRPTRSSDSTARSVAAPMSSATLRRTQHWLRDRHRTDDGPPDAGTPLSGRQNLNLRQRGNVVDARTDSRVSD
jgi:hypothetical protein